MKNKRVLIYQCLMLPLFIMKTAILALLAILTLACSNQDDNKTVTVQGRVVRESNNAGVPNAKIYISIKESRGTGPGSYIETISRSEAITDSQGNFSIAMAYNKEDNFLTFDKEDDENYTATGGNSTITEIQKTPIILKVQRYERLKVNVKNTTPFDSTDEVSVDILKYSGGYNPLLYVEDRGIKNTVTSGRPYWIGINVDSSIYYKIVENTPYNVFWNITRKGITTRYFSADIKTITDVVNIYDLNY